MFSGPISVILSTCVRGEFDHFAQTGRGSLFVATSADSEPDRGQVIDYFGGQHRQNTRCGCGAVLSGDCPVCGLGGFGAVVADRVFTVASEGGVV
ncbi:MAG: hypothetical protein ACSHX3_15825 [Litorimonas sp.]